MPANLTATYKAAEARFREAVSPEEKLAALEEMLREIPKHKGTEKLQADLRSRISKLKRAPRKQGPATRGPSHRIPHAGAGQVVLVGLPNAGKSSLVGRLTHARPEVAEYPMSTREATPGMMYFEDVGIQLVDLPPLCDEHVEPWVYDLTRAGDLAWLVLASSRMIEGIETVTRLLAAKAIALVPPGAPDQEAEEEDGTARRRGWTYLPTVAVVTGVDRPGAAQDVATLRELVDLPWPCAAVSTLTGEGLPELAGATYRALGVIRVYSKEPGKEPDREAPFTLPRGATVEDLAVAIHKDLADTFKFARVWGTTSFDGQRVPAGHLLEEGDVVEIHA